MTMENYMSLDINILKLNIGGAEVSVKLISNNFYKDTVRIAGRDYSIEYSNSKTIPLIKQAVEEILKQPIKDIEEFQTKLREKISTNYSNNTDKISELSSQISSSSPAKKKILQQTLSKEVVNNYLKKLENCPYFSGVVKVQFSDGSSSTVVAKGSIPDQQFNENTKFNIMSVGKLFTALGIMQLVEQGKLELDAPINKYMTREQLELKETDPQYIKDMRFEKESVREKFFNDIRSSSITVKELLTHTAGIIEHGPNASEGYCFDSNEIGKYNYSNYGYQLLARIIENQSREPFVDYVQKNIFQNPNNSENIMPGASKDPPLQEPSPCFIYKEQLHPINTPSVPTPDGNGCWWMTAGDLVNFTTAFIKNQYLSNELKMQMLTSVVARDWFLDQGLGFALISKEDEPNAFMHQGSFDGRSAVMCTLYDEETTVTVAALCNNDNGSNFFVDFIDMAKGKQIENPLGFVKEESNATKEALDWLLKLSSEKYDRVEITKYLIEHNIPHHLLKLMSEELKPDKPDIANILCSI